MGATSIKFMGEAGSFYQADDAPVVSSERKVLHRGTFIDAAGARTDAVLAVFRDTAAASYATEVACLARNGVIGVGPRLLCPYVSQGPRGQQLALVEEYAGVSLERAIFDGAPIDAESGPAAPLAPPDTDTRAREARKICFDVLVQLANMHANHVFHRDLRAANVCVKRYGPASEDLHATIIDFELSAIAAQSRIRYRNEPYTSLFLGIPASMGVRIDPAGITPLMIDMAYFAALQFEVTTGQHIDAADPNDLARLQGAWPLVAYVSDGSLFARHIDHELDIEPRARELCLPRVDAQAFPDPELLAFARDTIHHGGYLDAYDRALLARRRPETKMYGAMDGLTQQAYRRYIDQTRATGAAVAFATLEAQPDVLADSTAAQVRDIPAKVHAIGCSIVAADRADPARRIERFAPEEVEYLAYLEHRRWCRERRDAGWTYGPVKDVERRISNALVPYGELDEASREYNRAHVRDIPRLLAQVDLAIVR